MLFFHCFQYPLACTLPTMFIGRPTFAFHLSIWNIHITANQTTMSFELFESRFVLLGHLLLALSRSLQIYWQILEPPNISDWFVIGSTVSRHVLWQQRYHQELFREGDWIKEELDASAQRKWGESNNILQKVQSSCASLPLQTYK